MVSSRQTGASLFAGTATSREVDSSHSGGDSDMQPDRLQRIRHEGQIGCGCRARTHHNHVREQGRFRIHRVREVRVPGDRHPDRPLPRREHRPVHVRPALHRPHAGHLQHYADVHLLRQVPGAPDRPVQVWLHQQVQVRAGGAGSMRIFGSSCRAMATA